MSKTSPDDSTATPVDPDGLPAADGVLDIAGEHCPMTFVRTRLALDRLPAGKLLKVILRGAEPARSVPAQVRSLGHEILSQTDAADGTTVLLLRRR